MEISRLKQIWQENGFRPKKRMGQNFLVDKNVRDNIIRTVVPNDDSTIVEIGPGFGAMTFQLAEGCGKLFAVEKDDTVSKIMKPLFEEKGNITLVNADILDIDLKLLTDRDENITVYGNIPYYISTPIIQRMIEQRSCISNVYLVIQEEVANRIVSPPGSKVYGSLSCYLQYYTKPEKLIKIRKNSFYPTPQVDSCLLKMEVLREPSVKVKDEHLMFKIIRKAFQQRRKKMVNPLSDGEFSRIDKAGWEIILNTLDIDEKARAEDISLKEYASITDLAVERFKALVDR